MPATTTAKPQAPPAEGGGGNQAGKGGGEGVGDGTGDDSIQKYGAAAAGSGKAAVSGAVHSFLAAMAAGDNEGICASLAKSNREQLAQFVNEKDASKGCADALAKLINPSLAKAAKAAADAPVTSVRIKGDTAFALFTPKGGGESYLVMKREGNAWKSIGITPGTALEPTANP